jgi:hypothetical protein
MRIMKLGLYAGLTAAMGLIAGCGVLGSFIEAEIGVTVPVDGTNNTFSKIVTIDTNEIADIRDNRSKIKEGTFKVPSIQVVVESRGTGHLATLGWGQVYVVADGQDFPAEDVDNADAAFEAVPLKTGQTITLDISPAHATRLAETIFSNPKLQAKVIGSTDVGPVNFNAKVIFHVEFEAGL